MARIPTAPTKWHRVRKLFNDIHLWLGLTSGLIVIAVCFSGTLYTFNTEITEWGAPHLYKVKNYEGQQRLALDSLLKKVEVVAQNKVGSVVIPAALDRTYQFSLRSTAGQRPGASVTYFVNPYSGEIVGDSKEKNWAKDFMSTLFSLHRWLLLDKVEKPIIKGVENRKLGSIITGGATIIFTLGCITGLIIWFPQKIKFWRQGLKIKWNGGWKRLNHDLHNTLAFYALFFLLLMGLTGPQWSFEWYRTGLQKTLGTYKPAQQEGQRGEKGAIARNENEGRGNGGANKENKPARETETHNTEQKTDSLKKPVLTIAGFISAADSLLPYEGNLAISFAGGARGPAGPGLTKTKTGFFAPAAGDRITLNANTGAVEKTEIFKQKPFNERLAGSIKAIHVGNVYGTFTKILYFLACLIATSLPVTGTMIWLNKLKKKRKRRAPAVNPGRVRQPAAEQLNVQYRIR